MGCPRLAGRVAGHGHGHLGHACAPGAAGPGARGADAARADLRPVRGVDAAAVLAHRPAAAGQDRAAPAGAPGQRDQRDRSSRGKGLRRAAAASRRPAHHPGHDHPVRTSGSQPSDGRPERSGLHADRVCPIDRCARWSMSSPTCVAPPATSTSRSTRFPGVRPLDLRLRSSDEYEPLPLSPVVAEAARRARRGDRPVGPRSCGVATRPAAVGGGVRRGACGAVVVHERRARQS